MPASLPVRSTAGAATSFEDNLDSWSHPLTWTAQHYDDIGGSEGCEGPQGCDGRVVPNVGDWKCPHPARVPIATDDAARVASSKTR